MAERGLQGGQGLVRVAGLEDVSDGGPGVQGAAAGGFGIGLGPVIAFALGRQQSVYGQVDDLMVAGDGPVGQRTLFIGVRRSPKADVSQKPFVKLMSSRRRGVAQAGDDTAGP